jgi:hypothetical protein
MVSLFFPGNIKFRSIAWTFRDEYSQVIKAERKALAHKVMKVLTNLEPPCRFLEPTEVGYREVSKSRVLEKICQTLREKKFQQPKPEDSKRVVKSFHYLTSLKKGKNSCCEMVPVKAKAGNEYEKVTSTKKKVVTIERGGKAKHLLSSPGVSRTSKPKLVSPDTKIARYSSKGDKNNDLACPIFTEEDETDRSSSDWHLQPRVLFPEEDHEDDVDDQLDVFGRTTSFLPKLEPAHSETNGGALTQTLEDELFEPLFADEFYPHFDPLGDEHNEPMSFEVPPSLVSFFSGFSKKAPTFSTSPTTVLDAHGGCHLISDHEDDERVMGWVEGGTFF